MDKTFLGVVNPEFPWCSGVFEDRSITVGGWNVILALTTPASGFQGRANMIVNGRFNAPEDGDYLLYIFDGLYSAITGGANSNSSAGLWTGESNDGIGAIRLATAISGIATNRPPNMIVFVKMRANDRMTTAISIGGTVSSTTLQHNGTFRRFLFQRIS